jgi:uracil-DNA glycosylase family 4
VENVTDRTSNPFGMSPSCTRFVPGYGDANADFHVIGDHPGVHGGSDTTVPFTNEAGMRLQRALADAGLIDRVGEKPDVNGTFLSYLHMCVVDGKPTEREYVDMERFFDAELRAIAAHVLLPVGERATRHVLETHTARAGGSIEMDELHANEIRGSGFLVYPIYDPSEWGSTEREQLVQALSDLQATDFYREVDLGRFLASNEPYHVR